VHVVATGIIAVAVFATVSAADIIRLAEPKQPEQVRVSVPVQHIAAVVFRTTVRRDTMQIPLTVKQQTHSAR
jgi:hypothetical protein